MGSFPYHLKSHYPYKFWYLGYKNCFFFFSPENMICLMFSQSHWSMATIFFYTCFWIPLLQMKRALARLVGFVFFFPCQVEQEEDQMGCNQMCLPVARFQDLQDHGSLRCGQEALEETCSICLVEFEKEDVVSQLSKCGHVFHMDCIERWIERSHFTCPICRSLFFSVKTSHAKWDEGVNSSSSYLSGVSWYY